jgi:hypothetical protein
VQVVAVKALRSLMAPIENNRKHTRPWSTCCVCHTPVYHKHVVIRVYLFLGRYGRHGICGRYGGMVGMVSEIDLRSDSEESVYRRPEP